MNADYQVKLTADEIVVLASLLKYESVLGIESELFSNREMVIRDEIKKTVFQLEYKKIILYGFQGELQIDSVTKKIIDMVCNPEYIVGLDYKSGLKTDGLLYIVMCGEEAVLFQHSNNYSYTLELYSRFQLNKFLENRIKKSDIDDIHVSLKKEDIRMICEKIEAFMEKEALHLLEERVGPNLAEKIIDLFSKRSTYIQIEIYENRKNFFKSVFHSFSVQTEKRLLTISENDLEEIDLDTVSTEKFCGEILDVLSKG